YQHTRGAMAQPKVKADLPIEALLKEKRKFPPPKAFVTNGVMNKKAIYAEAARNPVKFWEARARELHWFKPWKKALEWKAPYAKWFVGGKLNVAYNCLDRHVEGPRRTKAALIWEGEPGRRRLPARRDGAAQEEHGRGAAGRAGRADRHRAQAHGSAGRDAERPRHLVGRLRQGRGGALPGRADGFRGPPVFALHVGV